MIIFILIALIALFGIGMAVGLRMDTGYCFGGCFAGLALCCWQFYKIVGAA